MREHRDFTKDLVRLEMDFRATDQNRRVPPPPLQKEPEPGAPVIELPSGAPPCVRDVSLATAVENRRSRRTYSDAALGLDELAFLLWATQGVRDVVSPGTALRTVPSAGARHAFETYLCVFRVDSLEPGLYRYLPLSHQLVSLGPVQDLESRVARAALRQKFCGTSAVTFIWSAIPYRMEWRYGLSAHRVLLIDAGHVGQNLYLACEAIDAGTCAVAAYDQGQMDALLGLDGDDEYTIYLASVGKRR